MRSIVFGETSKPAIRFITIDARLNDRVSVEDRDLAFETGRGLAGIKAQCFTLREKKDVGNDGSKPRFR